LKEKPYQTLRFNKLVSNSAKNSRYEKIYCHLNSDDDEHQIPKAQLISDFLEHIMIHKTPDSTVSVLLFTAILLSGCTLEFANTRPAREIRALALPKGDLYAGWRVFQDKCSSCHGMAATGGNRAPDLLPKIRETNPRQFAALVLKRYDLGSGATRGSQDPSTLEKNIDEIMRRDEAPVEMPAWQSEPAVNAHILDLYAYLSARSEGKLGTERPQR
jgi:mono/diheme cytochrome c family protein